MAKQAHLQAILSAVDRISPVLRQVAGSALKARLGLGALNTVNFNAAQRKLGMLQKTFRDVGSASRNVLGGLGLPATVGLGALGFGFLSAGKGALEYAGALQDAKDNTGLTTGAFQELQLAFEAAGVSSEDFTGAVTKLNKGMGEAAVGKDKGLLALMTKLRIPLRDAKGAIRSVEQVLPELSDAFAKNTNPAVRTRMAMELFGKSGAKLIAILMQGGASLATARKEAQRLGAVLSEDSTGALDDLGDAMGVLNRQVKVQTAEAFGIAAPAILAATKGLQEWIASNKELLQQKVGGYITRIANAFRGWVESGGIERLASGIHSVIDGFSSFVRFAGGFRNVLIGLGVLVLAGPVASLFSLAAALGRLGIVLVSPIAKLGGLAAAFAKLKLLAAPLLFNPIVIGIAAIAAGAYLIYRNWDTVGPFLAGVWERVKTASAVALNVLKFVFAWSPLGMLVNNWGPISEFVGGVWQSVSAVVTSGLALLGGLLQAWKPLQFVRDAWDPVVTFLQGVWDRIGGLIGPLLRSIGGAAGAVGGFFSNKFGADSTQSAQYGPRLGPTPLATAGALQAPAARVQGDVRVRFDNAPQGMRVEQSGTNTPGLTQSVDVGYRSMGGLG